MTVLALLGFLVGLIGGYIVFLPLMTWLFDRKPWRGKCPDEVVEALSLLRADADPFVRRFADDFLLYAREGRDRAKLTLADVAKGEAEARAMSTRFGGVVRSGAA